MKIAMFKNKNVLILCPHQDDEINIAGGLLPILKDNNCKIKVAYTTNGDYFVNKKYRYKEAIKSLKVFGISKENIIFLGYPDCLSTGNNHLYTSETVWESKTKQKYTDAYNSGDYHYIKYGKHNLINRKNFINDIYNLINEELPDIIICVDYDSHADHRALSLGFENAMGMILKKNKGYNPLVLKSFAYPTSYLSYSDFNSYNIPETKFKKEKFGKYKYQNPYYDWNDRIIFKVKKCSKRRLLLLNKTFWAITKHHSQFIVNKTYSIINSDQTYFLRRTDNLLLNANIYSTSGDSKNLNDFMLFDSNDIMQGDTKEPVINLGEMQFDKADKTKEIKVILPKRKDINIINIYQSVNCKNKIKKVLISYDDKKIEYNVNLKNFCYKLSNLGLKDVKEFSLKIIDDDGEIKLTEIEAFSKDLNLFEEQAACNNTKETVSLCNKVICKCIFVFNDITIFFCRAINKLIRIFRKIYSRI